MGERSLANFFSHIFRRYNINFPVAALHCNPLNSHCGRAEVRLQRAVSPDIRFGGTEVIKIQVSMLQLSSINFEMHLSHHQLQP